MDWILSFFHYRYFHKFFGVTFSLSDLAGQASSTYMYTNREVGDELIAPQIWCLSKGRKRMVNSQYVAGKASSIMLLNSRCRDLGSGERSDYLWLSG